MRKLTLSLAVMAALLPARVLSLGLGEIELKSALNQELDATVEVLSIAPEEVEQVIVKLASREAFARAGIDRSFALQDLKFKTEVKGDRAFIHITTVDPIREPFLSFLVEVDWPNGHLLREYTLLLDPPIYNTGAPAFDEANAPSFSEPVDELAAEPAAEEMAQETTGEDIAATDMGEPAVSSLESAPSEEAVAQAEVMNTEAEASYQPMPQHVEVSGEYRVKKGDTLWNLANQFRPDDSVSVEQMMLAMVHENPECFIKENIHGVKRGYILRMPNRDSILAVDRATAMAQVKQHTALWREYRQAMAAAVPASAMEAEDRGADTTAPAEGEQQGRLNIVGSDREQLGETGTGTADPKNIQKLKRELALAREALESERMQKENLNARLAELEQRVQRVLDMDDAELAKLQADLAGVKKEADQAAAQATEKLAAEVVKEEAAKEPAVFADEQKPQTAVEPGAEVTSEPVIKEGVTEEAAAKPAKPKKKPKPATPPPPHEPSLVDSILENLTSLPVLGGLLLLVLGGAAAVVVKRRRAKANEQQWAELNSAPLTADDFESVGPVVVKAQKTEQLDLDATAEMPAAKTTVMEKTVVGIPSDEAAPAEEVRDDVIAESDVYLAYGIYQQAEDLLRNALSQHPERDDYRMKLLETYFASKNAGSFADLAKEAKARKGNVKSYWDRVVVMGRELCPSDPMFSGAGAAIMPGLGADDLLPHKPATTDLELDAGGIELSPDLDLGMVETNAPDMGLDMDSTMIMQQPVQAESGVPELDLGADLESIANEMGAATTAPADTSAEMDLGDFSLDLDSAASSSEPALAMDAGVDDDFSLDFEASDLGLDSSDDQVETPELDASLDLAMDMEEPALDTGSLDMSMEEPASETVSLDMDMEMSEMDLGEVATPSATDSDDFDISSLSEDVDEVSTKLDLARAYMDMGDNEGAKNILEEVKAEGNSSQKKQAEELLARAG